MAAQRENNLWQLTSRLIVVVAPQKGLWPSACGSLDELGIIERFDLNFKNGTFLVALLSIDRIERTTELTVSAGDHSGLGGGVPS